MADKSVIVQTVMFDGRVAGNMVCWEDSNERHVGYWFGKEFWGKGIASAALSQLLDRLTTRPLVARVAKHNIASIRVLQKCGFTIVGEDRFHFKDGEYGEEYILTLGSNEGAGSLRVAEPPNTALQPPTGAHAAVETET